ncbi:MAG: bifunctional UDP-3-O-[3-hydroxymyristoyl] N-acetylglucosamine deacetylase/3-hydroxyacyl-ACP dehydratase [Fidelibacterota bacterium]
MRNQRTIKEVVSVSGKGLHTGVKSKLTFKPAPENTGYVFIRTDLEGHPEIAADIEHVVDISRGTTIEEQGNRMHTVEHVLAALAGMNINNCYIEVNNIEPPVCDGSAIEFVKAIKKAGIKEQNIPQPVLEIDKIVRYGDQENESEIHILPADKFSITCMVDYKIPELGAQYSASYDIYAEFEEDYASARTFCFLSEVEYLKEAGLIKGGDTSNALVFVDKKIDQEEIDRIKNLFDDIDEDIVLGENGMLNNIELRFKNEAVRHKVLDLVGDLALLGVPIKGHVLAARSGHKHNIELVKNIKKEYDKKTIQEKFQKEPAEKKAFLDIKGIQNILPHRYPFLLIDRIVDLEPKKRVHAYKNVTMNENFFQGHFPGDPVMPGVLLVEAMAQSGGLLLLNSEPNAEEKLVFFTGIDKVRFRKPVVPGDQVHFKVELLKYRMRMCKIAGKAYVDGEMVCEAEMMASVVDRDRK